MKKYTERTLRNYIREHSKWGPKQREERLCFFALALCGESGELANFVKKAWRGDFGSLKKGLKALEPKLVSETADVGAYSMMFLDLLTGGSLGEEVMKKFIEVEGREKYKRAEEKRADTLLSPRRQKAKRNIAALKTKAARQNPLEATWQEGLPLRKARHAAAVKELGREPSPMMRAANGQGVIRAGTWKEAVGRWLGSMYRSGHNEFKLGVIYAAGKSLSNTHPQNKHVEHKLRQVLQELIIAKKVERIEDGHYRILWEA